MKSLFWVFKSPSARKGRDRLLLLRFVRTRSKRRTRRLTAPFGPKRRVKRYSRREGTVRGGPHPSAPGRVPVWWYLKEFGPTSRRSDLQRSSDDDASRFARRGQIFVVDIQPETTPHRWGVTLCVQIFNESHLMRFTRVIALRCVLHRYGNQGIRR